MLLTWSWYHQAKIWRVMETVAAQSLEGNPDDDSPKPLVRSELMFWFLCLFLRKSCSLLLGIGLFLACLFSQSEMTLLYNIQILLTLVFASLWITLWDAFLILCTCKIKVCILWSHKDLHTLNQIKNITPSSKSLLIYKAIFMLLWYYIIH